MIIKFSPQVRNTLVEFIKIGNNLTIDGELLDIDSIPLDSIVPNDAIGVDSVNEIIKDATGNVTVEIVWAYSDSTNPINNYPADLINPVDGIIEPIASTQ